MRRIRKYLGSYLVQLRGKVDAIVMSAGVGENSPDVRKLVLQDLEVRGVQRASDSTVLGKGVHVMCCTGSSPSFRGATYIFHRLGLAANLSLMVHVPCVCIRGLLNVVLARWSGQQGSPVLHRSRDSPCSCAEAFRAGSASLSSV